MTTLKNSTFQHLHLTFLTSYFNSKGKGNNGIWYIQKSNGLTFGDNQKSKSGQAHRN